MPKRKPRFLAGPPVVKASATKVRLGRCGECGGEVKLNSFGLLPCTGHHPYFHECGKVLCSGRFCAR